MGIFDFSKKEEVEVKQPTKLLVGIDLGYGQVKVLSENQQYKFLSAVGTPISDFGRVANVSSKEELLNALAITYEGQKYYIGHNAITNTRNGRLSLRQNKAELEENRIKFITALALLTKEDDTELEVDVISGLPVLEFKNQKDNLFNMIYNYGRGFDFTMHYGPKSVHKSIRVKNVRIISQGEGSFYDFILDETGNIIQERANKVSGTIMVVDPGYKTTDIVTMETGRYVEVLSDQFNKGINQVHNECIRLIMDKFGVKKEMKDIDEIIRTGVLFHNTKEYNISKIIEDAAKPFAIDIVDNLINLSNDQLGSMQHLLLTGGGGNVIYPYLKAELEGIIEVSLIENSEFSNANGYYKYGKLLENAGQF
jgi:plasmid segregation protein ParM